MDKLYKRLSLALVKTKSIDSKEAELYEYAIKIVIQDIINTIVIISVGLILGMIKECLCMYGTFFILRKFTGGFHAKSYAICLISSTLIITASLFIIKYLEQNSYQILFLCLTVFFTILIWIFAPAENANKILSDKEKKVFKIISIVLSIVLLLIIVLLWSFNNVVLYSVGFGLIIVGSLLLMSKVFKGLYTQKRCS